MKIFISWSGDYSREVAEKLSVWIPSVIQSVETFYSPIDIGKGENWSNRLSQELAECTFGIVCLTPENVSAPWIHFEAGALAKSMDSRLSSIMFGVKASEVKGPLSRFQNTKFEREDFFRLIQAINSASDNPLKLENLSYTFDTMWERLDKDVTLIVKKYNGMFDPTESEANVSDAIQEILSILRKLSSNANLSTKKASLGINNILLHNPSIREFRSLKFEKNPYISELLDSTKRMISTTLPEDSAESLIQSLEKGEDFQFFMVESKAQELMEKLSVCPDLNLSMSLITL